MCPLLDFVYAVLIIAAVAAELSLAAMSYVHKKPRK